MPIAIKIYHNPACGTSRNTLALILNTGAEVEVIEYLINPPSKTELIQLIQKSGLTVREAIRKNVEPYAVLQLDKEYWTDEQLIDFMLQQPILINRPFVMTDLALAANKFNDKLCMGFFELSLPLSLDQLGNIRSNHDHS